MTNPQTTKQDSGPTASKQQTSSAQTSSQSIKEIKLPSASATPTPLPEISNSLPHITEVQESASIPKVTIDIHQPYTVSPEEEIEAVNNHSPHPIIAINGMRMTPQSIRDMAQKIANVFGRNVQMIPNNTDGFTKDVKNSLISILHNQKGIQAEKEAAQNLKNSLYNRKNDSYPIDIVGYSQGTLIFQDVLSEMRLEMNSKDPKQWSKFASRINLKTYGAAIKTWPHEIKAKDHRHLGDKVSLVGDAVSIQQRGQGLFHNQGKLKRAKATNLLESTHSIIKYLDNSSKFFLKEISNQPLRSQASLILNSMDRSDFSNKEYDKMMALVTAPALSSSEKEHNKSILLTREIYRALPKYPKAWAQLSSNSEELIQQVAKKPLKISEEKRSVAERRQRPGGAR